VIAVRWAIVLVVTSCYRGGAEEPAQRSLDEAPPAKRARVNVRYPQLEATAIRECTPDGPQKIVLLFQNTDTPPGEAPRVDWMQLDLVHGPTDPVPRTFTEGPPERRTAYFSPCFPHGCRVATVTIDELAVGGMIRGSYHLEVNAGETLSDRFAAKLTGAWEVRPCPRS